MIQTDPTTVSSTSRLQRTKTHKECFHTEVRILFTRQRHWKSSGTQDGLTCHLTPWPVPYYSSFTYVRLSVSMLSPCSQDSHRGHAQHSVPHRRTPPHMVYTHIVLLLICQDRHYIIPFSASVLLFFLPLYFPFLLGSFFLSFLPIFPFPLSLGLSVFIFSGSGWIKTTFHFSGKYYFFFRNDCFLFISP